MAERVKVLVANNTFLNMYKLENNRPDDKHMYYLHLYIVLPRPFNMPEQNKTLAAAAPTPCPNNINVHKKI